METIKLKVLDKDGHTRMTCEAAENVSLVYANAYQPGDFIALEILTPGRYCVVQFEDTMPAALVYVEQRAVNFYIPFGEQAVTYSPKSFVGDRHVIRARLATEEEIAARRNLAFNPYDQHGDTGFFPHASANVETRGEAVFAARNAIDGIFENNSHGEYPY
ncbi:MAG: carbohydrate-binding protein, partial [Blautia massiliensis (ex Durand et al. 2017)]